jgi:beta-xylosidase
MNINDLWSRSEFLTQAWVKWKIVVLSVTKEDSIMDTLSTKWILVAFQPQEFNLKILLHHRLLMRNPLNTSADC